MKSRSAEVAGASERLVAWIVVLLGLLACLAGCKASPATVPASRPGIATTGPDGETSVIPVQPFDLPLAADPERFRVLEAGSASAGVTGVLLGTGSVPLNDVVVYFTDADERYFAIPAATAGGRPVLLAVRTDALGHFATAPVFEKGQVILANALLSLNRRLVGLGSAGSGKELAVTVGSTYAVEFLRDTLATASATTFNEALGREDMREVVRSQGSRADGLISAGKLPEPSDGPQGDLVMGNAAALASAYVAHALARDRIASDAWAGVLGRRIIPLTTFAGNLRLRYNDGGFASASTAFGLAGPTAVTQGPLGIDAVFIADRDYHRIKRVYEGTIVKVAGSFIGDPTTATIIKVSGDETPGGSVDLGAVQEIKADSLGNLIMTFRTVHTVGFLCVRPGSYYGRAMAAGTFYRLGGMDGKEGYVDGPSGVARYRNPAGITLDEAGNVFVADRRNNRVRRIARQDGAVSTVLGDGWPFIAGKSTATGSLPAKVSFARSELGLDGTGTVAVADFGRYVDQPAGGTGAALKASFNRPLALAWRKVAGNEELYVYDSYNQAIRKAAMAEGGDFRDAAVTTVVGTIASFQQAAGYTVPVGIAGPAADQIDLARARFDLATYKPDNLALFQVVSGGLAIDAELGRLFVTDTNNRAIRMIDLGAGRVLTIARHDPRSVEGDARRCILSGELAGIAVLRDHGVVFADVTHNVIRRLHLQFGL